jgi:YfiH family protein
VSLPRFVIPDWAAPPRVHAATTTRAWSGDWQDPAARARLRRELALPSEPRWLRQVHGTRVVDDAEVARLAVEPEADAAITRAPGVVLAVRTADCLPILLAAADGSAVAAIHAGWRGLAAGVIESTVARWPASPETTLAWIGPAAGASAYEVDAAVRTAFVGPDPAAAEAFRDSRRGHWWCDLPALARRRLAALGIVCVWGGDRCTISESDIFYSWRRAAEPGRMATLIWIGV